MYTLLLDNTNIFHTTNREMIFQRSSMVDNFHILVPKEYNDEDMSTYDCICEYLLPISKKYKTMSLQLNNDNYKEVSTTGNDNVIYLEYIQPFTPEFTSEAGRIQLSLIFTKTEINVDENGEVVSKVKTRKTGIANIDIQPLEFWQDIVPDEALSAVDKKIVELQKLMGQYDTLTQNIYTSMPRDLEISKVTEDEKNLHLTSLIGKVGDGVSMKEIGDIVGKEIIGTDPSGENGGVIDLDEVPEVDPDTEGEVIDLDSLML